MDDHLLFKRRGPGPRELPFATVILPARIPLWQAYALINKLYRQACPCAPSEHQEIKDKHLTGQAYGIFITEEWGKGSKTYKPDLFCISRHPSQSSWDYSALEADKASREVSTATEATQLQRAHIPVTHLFLLASPHKVTMLATQNSSNPSPMEDSG